MAGSLSLRELGDDTIARLRHRAARHGHSIEAEACDILRKALAGEADPDFAALSAELRRLTANRRHSAAEILLLQNRDEV